MSSRYSLIVRRHWQRYRPTELVGMADQERFFAAKGHELELAVIEAEEALEEALEPAADYPARVGQLNQIRATAEQLVMALLLPPEGEEPDPPAPTRPATVEMDSIRRDLDQL